MKRLLPLLLFSFAFSANAQNYELFPNPSDTLAFKGDAGNVIFMSFDSVDTQSSQTIYWPHREVHFSGYLGVYDCWAHRVDTSWFGYRISHEHNSNEFLFECDNLTFALQASKSNYSGDSIGWMNYGGDTLKLLATTIGKFQKTLFNNQVDSVIETEIKFVGKTGNIRFSYPDSVVNVAVSKNNGIQAFPFLQITPMYYSQVISENRNNERIDYKLLYRREIFDFGLGDEFHYYSQYRDLMNGAGSPGMWFNHTIIAKSFPAPDSVVYQISEKMKTFTIDYTNMTTTEVIKTDTITKGFGQLDILASDQPSFQSAPNIVGTKITFWLKDTLQQRGVHILNNFFVDTGGNCLQGFIEPFYDRQVYREGFGLIIEEDFNFPSKYEFRLIYAKKNSNGQTWGTPYHIGMNELALKTQLKLYPNPASDVLNIELPNGVQQLQVSILDQLGRELIKQSIDNKNHSIAVSALSPGTYFIKTDVSQAIPFVKQ